MVVRRGRYGTFLACSGYPQCRNTRQPSTGVACPVPGCGGMLVERVGRAGRFHGCNQYPKCKAIFKGEPVKEPCPECHAPVMFERPGKGGARTLACINPSCKFKKRETGEEEGLKSANL